MNLESSLGTTQRGLGALRGALAPGRLARRCLTTGGGLGPSRLLRGGLLRGGLLRTRLARPGRRTLLGACALLGRGALARRGGLLCTAGARAGAADVQVLLDRVSRVTQITDDAVRDP